MLRESPIVVHASKRELLIAETKAKINPYAVMEGQHVWTETPDNSYGIMQNQGIHEACHHH
jgi:hypothetical protein